MTSLLDSKIINLKKQLDELIKQKETSKLVELCNIPKNKYVQDLTTDLQLKYEEAGENEYWCATSVKEDKKNKEIKDKLKTWAYCDLEGKTPIKTKKIKKKNN